MPLKTLVTTFLIVSCLGAQITSPSPGFVRYKNLPIKRVLGVGGSLVTIPADFGAADAASFSSAGVLLATDGQIKLIRSDGSLAAQIPYSGSTPLLSINNNLASAIAWLPAAHTILHWSGRDFVPIVLPDGFVGSLITSLSLASPDIARFLITNRDGTVSAALVSLSSGRLISSDILPGVEGPAYQLCSHLLWANREGLQIEELNGRIRVLPFELTNFSAEQMSTGWIHIFSRNSPSHYALSLNGAEPALWQIPAPHALPAEGGRAK